MKKISVLLLVMVVFITLCGCDKKDNKDDDTPIVSDAEKFKSEYESLNGKTNSSKAEHRTVSIDEDNPMVYSRAEDIIKKIENKETFYVYFGSSYCPWCRSMVEEMVKMAKKNNIDKIYYVDIWDGDHVEILRDTYKINDENKLELVKDGSSSYKKLLEYLDDVLGEYTLTDNDGKEVKVGEKRIFAPNVIYVEDGKAIRITEGYSDNQKGSRDELTEELLKDEEEKFQAFFNGEACSNGEC